MFDSSARAARDGEALHPVRLHWMLAFFVLSGVSGLIYQSIWSQYLALLLGSSAYAQSLVLAIFMGGMAVGAWIAAHLLSRLQNLLLAYAWIEGVIGIAGLVFHGLFLASTHWLYTRWLPELQSAEGIALSRWLLAALLIAPQTVLLGTTFPIMSAGLMRWLPDRAGAVLGGLYFYNSIGAAAGALLATFVLIPAAGLAGAMAFAGLLNLLILAGVYYARVPGRGEEAAPSPTQLGAAEGEASASAGFVRLILAVACLTGLSSFMYEVGWIRMLSLVMGSSQHAFELMLAAFIGGLALGGLYVKRRLDGVRDAVRYAAVVQLLMGLSALATLPLYDHAFVVLSALMDTFASSGRGYVLYTASTALIAIAIMLPAAFFAGMTLPVLTFLLLRRGQGEAVVGKVYALNTLGAIAGVLLMVHIAMPALGLKHAMVLAASLDLGLGVLLLVLAQTPRRARALLTATAVCTVAVVGVLHFADFNPMRLHSGVYRSRLADLDPKRSVYFSADGKTASIALHGIGGQSLTIATNGKPDASLNLSPELAPTPDEPTMILAALLGLAAQPEARDAAVIGFGSGLTTHVLTQHAGFASITTVEIEPNMVEAARGFGARVEGAFEDPRSKIVIDDARAYFSGAGARYDLIISEPSNPWVAGVSKLFSIEFYGFAKRHLKPGGRLVQWVQAYEISDATFLTILRALDSEFSDYALYLSNDSDLVIVATAEGRLPELRADFLAQPGLRWSAERAGIRSVRELRERRLADRRRIRPLLSLDGGPVNSDFRPVLSHWAPQDRYLGVRATRILGYYRSPLGVLERAGFGEFNQGDAWRDPPVALEIITARRNAEDFAALMLDASPKGPQRDTPADHQLRGLALRLRELGAVCFEGVHPSTANGLLLQALELTAPFLDEQSMRRLYVAPPWLPCSDGELPRPVDRLLDVLAAYASGDGTRLASTLRRLEGLPQASISARDRESLDHLLLFAARATGGKAAVSAELGRLLEARTDAAIPARFLLRLTAGVLEGDGALEDAAPSAAGTPGSN